jgi:UDP-N-acetylglucosamine 2-epimerase (non-hydrolysing)/GDP/UDP-N,N'-diacetylbacillosamine 2-epimerase (hydrolysing)
MPRSKPDIKSVRRVCFVSGTRAEFGLMRSTLEAIARHPKLRLGLIATGMHLSRSRGRSLDQIRRQGWRIDRVVRWFGGDQTPTIAARATGKAIAALAEAFDAMRTEIVLVVGDRVEAFAAAAAGHIGGRIVAHVHGGDRALGQVDDSLRHAITKLAHVHFPATAQSARRILRLGEDPWRVFQVGSPGIDSITRHAIGRRELDRRIPALVRRDFTLLVLHPADADPRLEHARAQLVLGAVRDASALHPIVIIYPNNDPGSAGIARCWQSQRDDPGVIALRDADRPLFLALMREAAVLVGNSSSGIIEAASFGTPVLDIGPRQFGREHSRNLVHCDYDRSEIRDALARIWRRPNQPRVCDNVYGGGAVGERIARTLARIALDTRTRRKLIAV